MPLLVEVPVKNIEKNIEKNNRKTMSIDRVEPKVIQGLSFSSGIGTPKLPSTTQHVPPTRTTMHTRNGALRVHQASHGIRVSSLAQVIVGVLQLCAHPNVKMIGRIVLQVGDTHHHHFFNRLNRA